MTIFKAPLSPRAPPDVDEDALELELELAPAGEAAAASDGVEAPAAEALALLALVAVALLAAVVADVLAELLDVDEDDVDVLPQAARRPAISGAESPSAAPFRKIARRLNCPASTFRRSSASAEALVMAPTSS